MRTVEAGAGKRRQNAKAHEAPRPDVPAASDCKRAPPISTSAQASRDHDALQGRDRRRSGARQTRGRSTDARPAVQPLRWASQGNAEAAPSQPGIAEPLPLNWQASQLGGSLDGMVRSARRCLWPVHTSCFEAPWDMLQVCSVHRKRLRVPGKSLLSLEGWLATQSASRSKF